MNDAAKKVKICCDDKAIIQLLGAFDYPFRESLSTSVDNDFTENFIY